MRPLRLTEYSRTTAVELSTGERDAMRALIPTMAITPTPGTNDRYDLTPGGVVGVVRIGDLEVEIAPRLPVKRVLFLVSYALDPRTWRSEPTSAAPDDHLLEALVPTFAHHVRAALRRGLLHGYRPIEETHTTVRGKIRIADQLRIRPGQVLPVELAYDDFTTDILENRLLRAAVDRLAVLPLRHAWTRRVVADLREQFSTVAPMRFMPGCVPVPHWSRLNARYRPAVAIARLIIAGAALDLTAGNYDATGVLFDMAAVFENFVIAALREVLGVSRTAFPQGARGRSIHLDMERRVPLKPDLSWWIGDRCVFVGDCKYKRATSQSTPNADLYQLLAYTTALDLDDGVLVYAAGEHPAGTHTVAFAAKRLHVATLDLAGEPPAVLAEIATLGERIRRLVERSHAGAPAA